MEAQLKKRFVVACAVATVVASTACSKDKRYEGVVQVIRKEIVEQEDDGTPITTDFELEWDPCPGDQYQVVRGGRNFSACAKKYKVGDYLPVVVLHYWDERGFYRWDIEKMGDCHHTIQPEAEGSYEKSQECHDVQQYGRTVGFTCSRRPFKDLVARCPFLARQ